MLGNSGGGRTGKLSCGAVVTEALAHTQGPKLGGPAKARGRPFNLSLATGCPWARRLPSAHSSPEGLGGKISAAYTSAAGRTGWHSPAHICAAVSKGHACAHFGSWDSVHIHSLFCLSRPSPALGIDWMGRRKV